MFVWGEGGGGGGGGGLVGSLRPLGVLAFRRFIGFRVGTLRFGTLEFGSHFREHSSVQR